MFVLHWIGIVSIGLLFPFTGLRLAQSHDPCTESTFTFVHPKGGICTLPESNRGCSRASGTAVAQTRR